MKQSDRIIALQKQLSIARKALRQISEEWVRNPQSVAYEALEEMERYDRT